MAKYFKYSLALFALTVAVGCSNNPVIGMANPASVYCEEVGGVNVIKEDGSYCQLPGRTIEVWELYKAKDRDKNPTL